VRGSTEKTSFSLAQKFSSTPNKRYFNVNRERHLGQKRFQEQLAISMAVAEA